MKIDKTSSEKPVQQSDIDLSRLPAGRIEEISQIFEMLGLEAQTAYPGADQFSKRLQKVSKLQFDGITFTTTAGIELTPKLS